MTMYCDLCHRDNIEVLASLYCMDCEERMCEECAKHHRRNKQTVTHTLLDVNACGETCIDSQTKDILGNIRTYCETHQRRSIEYICVSHNTLCCTECVIKAHRKCENVPTLTEYKNSAKFHQETVLRDEMVRDISKKADVVAQISKRYIECDANKKGNFEECLKHLISSVTAKATALFRTKEGFVESVKSSTDSPERLVENMNHILEFDCRKRYTMAEEMGTVTQNIVAAMDMTKVLKLQEGEVRKSLKIVEQLKVLEIDVNIYPILKAVEENFKIKAVGLTIGGLKPLSAVKVETPKQLRKCVFIDNNTLLTCSHHGNMISAIDAKANRLIASVDLKSAPWGIAKRDIYRALVSLPLEKKVVQITCQQSTLKTNYVATKTALYCIDICSAKGDDTFIATSKETGHFYFINWQGEQLQEVSVPSLKSELVGYEVFRNKILSYVDDIAVHSEQRLIFASAPKLNRVFAFGFDGALKYTLSHPDIQTPMGIADGCNNCVLVCSYGNHQVHELRATDCSYNRAILTNKDGLTGPLDVCFNVPTKRLAICECDSGRELKIFSII